MQQLAACPCIHARMLAAVSSVTVVSVIFSRGGALWIDRDPCIPCNCDHAPSTRLLVFITLVRYPAGHLGPSDQHLSACSIRSTTRRVSRRRLQNLLTWSLIFDTRRASGNLSAQERRRSNFKSCIKCLCLNLQSASDTCSTQTARRQFQAYRVCSRPISCMIQASQRGKERITILTIVMLSRVNEAAGKMDEW